MKKLFLLVLIFNFNNSLGMEQGAPASGDLLVRQVFLKLSLMPKSDQTITKALYIPAQQPKKQAGVVCGIPESIGNNVLATLHAVQMQEENSAALRAINVFMRIMCPAGKDGSKGKGGDAINQEMCSFLEAKQSTFLFSPSTMQLLLTEDLGEHAQGWAFNKVIEIDMKNVDALATPVLTIQYHNAQKNIHGKVRFSELVSKFSKTGPAVHHNETAAVVALAQSFVARLK